MSDPVPNRPATLLLADDSVTIHRVVELTFADEGVTVIAVRSGESAIASLAQSRPDIVLADIGMADGNGYDVARHVRNSPALAHIPVLLLTGAFEPVDRELASAVGCEEVLTKPFEPRDLVRRVRALLGQATSEPIAATPEARPASVARLDDYFAELDEALAARVGVGPVFPSEADSAGSSDEGSASAEAASVFVAPPFAVSDEWTPPEDSALPSPGFSSDSPRPAAPSEPTAAPVASMPGPPVHPASPGQSPQRDASAPVATPLLAGAFSALLAAEQAGSAPNAFADWLPEERAPVAVSDEMIETIVERVIARLSDTVVRDAVSAIALATAERLVREEIERIKNNIK